MTDLKEMPVKIDKHVFLKVRSPMSDFLAMVKGQIEPVSLSEEWRQAREVINILPPKETNIVDNSAIHILSIEPIEVIDVPVIQSLAY